MTIRRKPWAFGVIYMALSMAIEIVLLVVVRLRIAQDNAIIAPILLIVSPATAAVICGYRPAVGRDRRSCRDRTSDAGLYDGVRAAHGNLDRHCSTGCASNARWRACGSPDEQGSEATTTRKRPRSPGKTRRITLPVPVTCSISTAPESV